MSSTSKPSVLVVLTSVGKNRITGDAIGWFLPEFAHAYDVFAQHMNIVVASPAGGEAPLDKRSIQIFQDHSSVAFLKDHEDLWMNTARLSDFVGKSRDFEALFFVGGHGPMFDIVDDEDSIHLIQEFAEKNKVLGAVCHGPVAFLKARLSDGSPLIKDCEVTGFSNSEEDALGHTHAMPFLVETELNKISEGKYIKAEKHFDEKIAIARNGKLVTGQNPASTKGVAEAMVKALGV
ncbi:ThiJ/PfpI family protein [Xylogone sp. PMI_703]|nr:ThiJ/PfpI family protein [Xylogone sp. PMI_703]